MKKLLALALAITMFMAFAIPSFAAPIGGQLLLVDPLLCEGSHAIYSVACNRLNVRQDPSTANKPIGQLRFGDALSVLLIEDGWAKIVWQDGTAYVSAQYIALIKPGVPGISAPSSSPAVETGKVLEDLSGMQVFSKEANLDIPPIGSGGDGFLTESTITVTTADIPAGRTVAKITIGFNIDHGYDADLDITLFSPAGTPVLLVADRGGSGDHFIQTVFDDDAATPISDESAPFTGTFRPEQPLSAFVNESVHGDWKLSIDDDDAGVTGTLKDWTLTIYYK